MKSFSKTSHLALLFILTGLSACASTSPATISTIRESAQTAPADLQLLCAGEAQNRFGAPANSVLPVGSRPGPAAGTYAVDLKLPVGQATCVIDSNGAISLLEQV